MLLYHVVAFCAFGVISAYGLCLSSALKVRTSYSKFVLFRGFSGAAAVCIVRVCLRLIVFVLFLPVFAHNILFSALIFLIISLSSRPQVYMVIILDFCPLTPTGCPHGLVGVGCTH